MPFSSAIFLAKGETNNLPESVFVFVFETTALASCLGASILSSTFLAFSFVASSFGASSFLAEEPSVLKFFAIDETSVPAGPIIANKESTFAEAPSSKPINNKVPD